MADVLSHVLLAFAVFTVIGWAISWLDREWAVVGMVGAIFPDLTRLGLVVDDYVIAQTLGIPFDWEALATVGGVLLLSAIGAVLFPSRRTQLRAFGLLLAGSSSHLVIDGVKAYADGANGALLYPLSWWRNPTPGWYVSSDRWVLVGAVVSALVVLAVDRYMMADSGRQ
ncbi:metal-dependent hydrolase [Halobacteriaceae archaeon SHR40]|uniref:metal-dependent hydrolase n=1 Tax=Halovenus amylolytica TaxID=2500550 RepID=UPI000FE398DF